jgi:diacylglycerol O-acyltransferase
MKHLSALDAGFLQAEDSDPHANLAIGGLSIIDGPMPDYDDLFEVLAQRLQSAPRMRQVVRTHRLDMSAPEWSEVADLDLDHHIRRAALPQPGDDAALSRLVADIVERRLDRDRPLWECWIIEGLTGGRWALLMKVHHCMADGISASHLMTGIADNGPHTESFAEKVDGSEPKRALPSISLNPLVWTRTAWGLSSGAIGMVRKAAEGTVSLISELAMPAQHTSLNGPITGMRRYRTASVSMDDVNDICAAYDVTVNDVALTAITHGYRDVLKHRNERLTGNTLRTLVPVSVRDTHDDDAMDAPDNRVSVMLPLLPVNRANPLDQLRIVHERMTKAKCSGQKQAGTSAVGAAGAIPFPLTAWTVRTLTRLPQRSVVALATNVPGPREVLQVLGRDVLAMFPIPPLALRLRTSIAMLSYAQDLTFGVVADYDGAPDLDVLVNGIEAGVTRLAQLAHRRK